MISNSNNVEEEFTEAKNNWNLEKLYIDLASAKGKALTPVEKKFLRGLLCGLSPAEIAKEVYKSRSSSTVRVYLSNGLYKYLEEMLSIQAGSSIKVKNWSRVTHLLEKAGYKKKLFTIEKISNGITANKNLETDVVRMKSAQKHNWGEAIDVSLFHGRSTELASIAEWILQEHCRLAILLGMGGIGKTALSVKLAEQVKDRFEYVIWRSLRLAPSLEVLLNQIIPILDPDGDTGNPVAVEDGIGQLMDCLRSSRCLIVLDHFDAILCSSYRDGSYGEDFTLSQICYRPGYEIYGELLLRLGESQHQSSIVLTSREKPQEIAAMEGKTLPVRSLKLTGLDGGDIRRILQVKGLVNCSEEEGEVLFKRYGGNPLFIQLVATAIQELFAGNIHEFLAQDTLVFGDTRMILDQQFQRLSSLEKQIMYWLALNQDFASLRKLQRDIIPRVSQRLILEAIELLQRRSLIEGQLPTFFLTPVLMEYIAEIMIEENFQLSQNKSTTKLFSYTIFETHLKNYIRENRRNA
ncbi:MAG: NB-ARC domain-containing protein [Nostocaceae cyanobacterium]|nr:NB-ARC domain-containing protein [Nostocaceae cyanobacterium]